MGVNIFAGGLTVSANVVKLKTATGGLDSDLRRAGIKVLTREQTCRDSASARRAGKFYWEYYNYV